MRTRSVGAVALIVVALALVSAAPRNDYTSEALKDEIINLPGAPKVNFRQFSGYITVNPSSNRRIFYWFVESQNSPKTDPLFLWTNGGPGCSGLIGKFTENGPFQPNADGTLSLREYAWNKIANFIFIEQPAGVGFSQIDDPSTAFGDANAAADNLAFVRGFLKKFPNYNSTDLYFSSESYGGHYLPTLALELVKKAPELTQFKGFAVGNPLTYMPHRDYGQYAEYAFRQLVPRPEWDAYIAAGCRPDPAGPYPNPAPARPDVCSSYEAKFDGYAANMDPYAIDFPVCTDAASGRNERAHFAHKLKVARLAASLNYTGAKHLLNSVPKKLKDYFPDYQPCADEWASAYLNRADVQKAIHAEKPVSGQWSDCANINYSQYDMITAMMPVYMEIIQRTQGNINILIYSGDDDSICSTADSQMFLWNMGLSQIQSWRQWHAAKNVAGMHVAFKGGLRFATIHGGGHMVPATRPAQGFQAIQNYLSGNWQ